MNIFSTFYRVINLIILSNLLILMERRYKINILPFNLRLTIKSRLFKTLWTFKLTEKVSQRHKTIRTFLRGVFCPNITIIMMKIASMKILIDFFFFNFWFFTNHPIVSWFCLSRTLFGTDPTINLHFTLITLLNINHPTLFTFFPKKFFALFLLFM